MYFTINTISNLNHLNLRQNLITSGPVLSSIPLQPSKSTTESLLPGHSRCFKHGAIDRPRCLQLSRSHRLWPSTFAKVANNTSSYGFVFGVIIRTRICHKIHGLPRGSLKNVYFTVRLTVSCRLVLYQLISFCWFLSDSAQIRRGKYFLFRDQDVANM